MSAGNSLTCTSQSCPAPPPTSGEGGGGKGRCLQPRHPVYLRGTCSGPPLTSTVWSGVGNRTPVLTAEAGVWKGRDSPARGGVHLVTLVPAPLTLTLGLWQPSLIMEAAVRAQISACG